MGKKILVGAAVLLLFAMGVSVLTGALESPGYDGPIGERVRPEGPGPATVGTSEPAEEIASADGPAPAEVKRDEGTSGEAGSRTVLRGRVLGPGPGAGAAARIVATGYGPYGTHTKVPVPATADADGAFAFSVAALFAQNVEVEEIHVRVDHPDYMPAETRVPVATGRPVEIRLVPAGAVTGRVVDEAGRGVTGAAVSLHRPRQDGGLPVAIESVRTDERGRYRLRSALFGPHVLIAVTDGLRPVLVEIAMTVGAETIAASAVLLPGVEITGRVRGIPADLVLEVRARRRGRSASTGWSRVCFVNGRPETARATAAIEPDGTFRLSGLAPGSHHLSVESVQPARLHQTVAASRGHTVTAPTESADIDLEVVRLDLRVLNRGEPVKRWIVEVNTDHGGLCQTTDGDGRATVWVRPHATYRVSAAGTRTRAASVREITTPGPGESMDLDFELMPERPHPSLVVTILLPPGSDPIRLASFQLLPADGGDRDVTRDVKATDGRFVLRDLPPGRWRLVVRAGGRWWLNDGPWLDATTEVSLPAEGEVKATVSVRLGGRLRIGVRDPAGRPVAPRCLVRDAKNREVPLVYTHRFSSGSARRTGRLAGRGVNHVDPALPAGRYALTLSLEGHEEKSVEFSIEKGRTTALDLTMEPAR